SKLSPNSQTSNVGWFHRSNSALRQTITLCKTWIGDQYPSYSGGDPKGSSCVRVRLPPTQRRSHDGLFGLHNFASYLKQCRRSDLSSHPPQESIPSLPSDLGSAAVHEQFDPRDETRVIRSQKQRRLRNFLGFPHASHWDSGDNPRDHVCRLPTRQWRIDRTRTNDV